METDILSGVSKTPSGVAPDRPDGARRLFTTAANVDKLLTNTLVVSTPACVHGRVETSQIGIYVDHRFTWRVDTDSNVLQLQPGDFRDPQTFEQAKLQADAQGLH